MSVHVNISTLQNHALEEEKAHLVYEMSDLELFKDRHTEAIPKMESEIKLLQTRLQESEIQKNQLQSRLDESAAKQTALKTEVVQHEQTEKVLHDRIALLEEENRRLRERLQQLGGDIMATEKKVGRAFRVIQ